MRLCSVLATRLNFNLLAVLRCYASERHRLLISPTAIVFFEVLHKLRVAESAVGVTNIRQFAHSHARGLALISIAICRLETQYDARFGVLSLDFRRIGLALLLLLGASLRRGTIELRK